VAVLNAECPTVTSSAALPTVSGLQLYDIGASNYAGSTSSSGNVLTLTGCGYVVPASTREGLAYLARKNFTQGAISTRVLSARPGVLPARAGVMMRDSTLDSARFASLAIDANGRVVFEYRASPNSFAVTKSFADSGRYLLLDRKGSTVTAMVSENGTNWRILATASIGLKQEPYVGLFVISSTTDAAATADFDGFDVVSN
jgi:hypothetical protein